MKNLLIVLYVLSVLFCLWQTNNAINLGNEYKELIKWNKEVCFCK